VTKRSYGILAGVIGSAVGAWWFARRRQNGYRHAVNAAARAQERGTVIFDNTPTASDSAVG
jgi:hypothetical protein